MTKDARAHRLVGVSFTLGAFSLITGAWSAWKAPSTLADNLAIAGSLFLACGCAVILSRQFREDV